MLGRCAPSRKACAKIRAVLGIVNRLIFWREHRFVIAAKRQLIIKSNLEPQYSTWQRTFYSVVGSRA
jgi:hypothetical protein